MKYMLKLFLVGVFPLILGIAKNYLLPLLPISGFIMLLIDLLVLILWGYLSFKVATSEYNSVVQSVILCSFGLLMLGLVLYQELTMNGYFDNVIGFIPQMFFLPFISIPTMFILPNMDKIVLSPIYIGVWICLFVVSNVGCYIKCRKNNSHSST